LLAGTKKKKDYIFNMTKTFEVNGRVNQEKVFNLTKEIFELRAKKKALNSGFNEEIKRVNGELKDLVEGKKDVYDAADKAGV
jgi:uncharacterized protein YkuJ